MNQLRRRPVIGMIIARPVRDHEIRRDLADDADDLRPVFQRWKQLSIVVFQNLIFRQAANFGGRLCFRNPPLGQRGWLHIKMSRIAVGSRNEGYLMSQLGQLDRTAAEYFVRIVRVGADDKIFSV